MSSEQINALAAHILASNYVKTDQYLLVGRDRISFDSIILCSDDFPLRSWSSTISTVAPSGQHYDLIKELAVDSSYMTAWSGLANFNREEDLPLLRENFSFNDRISSTTLDIIFRYPHPSFIAELKLAQNLLLRRKEGYHNFTELYLSVFQYTPEEIIPFLKAIDDYEDQRQANEHREGVWIAAQLHDSTRKRNLAEDIPKELQDKDKLAWWKGLARYASLD